MAFFVDSPKSVAVGTPADTNRWLASDANQVIDEIQNLLDDTGQTKSASDLFQTSKAVARYIFGNTVVENSGSSTHNGSADIYIVERDGGDSKQIPATLLRGIFPVKIVNANQSNNVSLQLGTNTVKEWKKFDMAGNLTEIAVGEFRADDIVFAQYDTDEGAYILKKALSDDEIEAIVGKFNILNFLDFTASAPTTSGIIGDRYINTTGGTISAGNVDTSGTTVVADKIYELYDISGGYNWREIDEQDGNLVFDDTSKKTYTYNGTSWSANTGLIESVQTFTSSGTWTKPAGITKVVVKVWGSGGGGGAGDGAANAGTGAGGGGYTEELITSGLGATETITVGVGGTGGVNGGAAATDGGDSSFGSFCSATGGVKGLTSNAAGVGDKGGGSGGNINIDGGAGVLALSTSYGGRGGACANGGGSSAGSASIGGDGQTGHSPGGGGSGGGQNGSGGDGTDGLVVVYEYK